MKAFRVLIILPVFLLFLLCKPAKEEIAMSSPNLKLQLIFKLDNGNPSYRLYLNGQPVLTDSRLGFKIKDIPSFNSGFSILDKKIKTINGKWEQPWGEVKTIENNYCELTVYLQEVTGDMRKMNIVFRLFNDGLGFRYEFPEQDNLKEFQITEELTRYSLPDNDTAWWIPAYKKERYEYLYRKTPLTEVDTAHTPFTVKTNKGLYLSFHEAALYDFPSYTLYSPDTGVLALDLVPWRNGVKAYVSTPFNTPWRTVQVAEKPGDLITNYIILNLNDSCKIDNLEWIKPAKYIGIWWGMHINKYTWGYGPKHGATNRNTTKYIDFAAKYGFDGVLVEGWNLGWDGNWIANGEIFSFTKSYPDFNLAKLAKYANENGVSLIGHHETSAHTANYEAQMEDAYKLYEDLGIHYIKTGYVGGKLFNGEWHHGQFGVRHYQKSVELAAKHHIMLDIHEPIKDCGIRRTWPNLMTREGARGTEWDAWGPDGGNPPNHVPTLVFTRLLAGPMDYTPGIFDIEIPSKPNNRVNTTLAKQLAFYVVIYSPLQMAADLPENYEGNPAFQFIVDVPCDWEETRVLNAAIGEYVTIIRKDRNSEDWYLGSITDDLARDFSFRLNFLDRNLQYKAQIYADGDSANWKTNPLPVNITERMVTNKDSLQIHLVPGGGQAVRFTPISDPLENE
jgi:alpha-glucosidase